MRIALISEFTQAARNATVETALRKAAEPLGHRVDNYGMYTADDPTQWTYVQNGLLASILLTAQAADFVVTGCGTGQGAMMACNSFPNVVCGYVADPCDGYLFSQVNAGNCVAMPFAQGFGWGAELNLQFTFEKLFAVEPGGGYPPERVASQKRNRDILGAVRQNNLKDLITCLKSLDPALVKGAVAGPEFRKLFFAECRDKALADYIATLLD